MRIQDIARRYQFKLVDRRHSRLEKRSIRSRYHHASGRELTFYHRDGYWQLTTIDKTRVAFSGYGSDDLNEFLRAFNLVTMASGGAA